MTIMTVTKLYKKTILQFALTSVEMKVDVKHNTLCTYLTKVPMPYKERMSEDILDVLNAELIHYYRIKCIMNDLQQSIMNMRIDQIEETRLRSMIQSKFSYFINKSEIMRTVDFLIEFINEYYDFYSNTNIISLNDINMKKFDVKLVRY